MLTENGNLYLVDFGSAQTEYEYGRVSCKGTPGFAAPEQLKGQAQKRPGDNFMDWVKQWKHCAENTNGNTSFFFRTLDTLFTVAVQQSLPDDGRIHGKPGKNLKRYAL